MAVTLPWKDWMEEFLLYKQAEMGLAPRTLKDYRDQYQSILRTGRIGQFKAGNHEVFRQWRITITVYT